MAQQQELVKTGYGNGQSNFPIKLYVTYESVQSDGATNESTITCGMYVKTPGSGWTIGPWDTGTRKSYVGTTSLTFDGDIPNFGGTRTLTSGKQFKVKHNDDGTGKATIYWKWGVNSSWGGFVNPSGSFEIDLPTIPRFPILKLGSVSTTLNTMTCSLSNSRSGTMSQYQVARVSDGITIIDTTCNGAFSFTVSSLTPNTSYSGVYKVRAYANGGWGDWLTITSTDAKTKTLPIVSTSATLDIDKANVIQFNNLNHISSYTVVGKTSNGNVEIVRVGSITTNNYSLTLTSAQQTTLASKYTNTSNTSLYFEITVVSNGVSYRVYTSDGKNPTTTYKILHDATYQPTFTDASVTNVVDTLHTAITGNNTKFIKNHNRMQGTIAPMVPKHGASGVNYTVSASREKSTVLNYSTSNQTFTLDNVDTNSISVVATDSRGFWTTVSKSITLINYENPSISQFNLTRQNGIGDYAILDVSGKYTEWSGLAVANTVSKVEYRWKLATNPDSSYSSWINAGTITTSAGTWSVNAVLPTVFDKTQKFYIQVRVTDKLETVMSSSPFLLSTANVFIWKDLSNKRLGINKKPDRTLDVDGEIGGKALWINGIKVIWNE